MEQFSSLIVFYSLLFWKTDYKTKGKVLLVCEKFYLMFSGYLAVMRGKLTNNPQESLHAATIESRLAQIIGMRSVLFIRFTRVVFDLIGCFSGGYSQVQK